MCLKVVYVFCGMEFKVFETLENTQHAGCLIRQELLKSQLRVFVSVQESLAVFYF